MSKTVSKPVKMVYFETENECDPQDSKLVDVADVEHVYTGCRCLCPEVIIVYRDGSFVRRSFSSLKDATRYVKLVQEGMRADVDAASSKGGAPTPAIMAPEAVAEVVETTPLETTPLKQDSP